MDMGMEGKVLTPCVQDRCDSRPGAEEFRISGQLHNSITRRLQKDGIQDTLVLIKNRIKLLRQSKDHVEIANRKKL